MSLTPSVTWAQRNNLIFLSINVPDVALPEIKVEKDSLHFKGVGGADKKTFELNMKFLKEVNTETVKFKAKGQGIDVAIEKAEEGPYWERLLQDKTKAHWLKIDFSRWKDEDESDEEGGEEGGMPGMGGMGGMEQMMAQMGGMGGMGGGMGGMPGMGGMGGMGGMDMAEMMKGMKMPAGGEDDGEGDSDDEELPDLE